VIQTVSGHSGAAQLR